tara:strand:+ start:385 stop:573 length:189 start_codon:yes stop_codon:yes gene_type:complete
MIDDIKQYENEVFINIGRVHIRVIKDDEQQDVYIYDNLRDGKGQWVDEDFKTKWSFVKEKKE